MQLSEYPVLKSLLEEEGSWQEKNWLWARDFLLYIGRNKSEHTFTRFRSEVEKFLLWCFLIHEKPAEALKKNELLDYSEFFFKPPKSWITLANHEKFQYINGYYQTNKNWKPFRYISKDSEPDIKKYRPSLQSMQAMFTALIAFYKYLMDEEICFGNPAQLAKKDCKRLYKDAQVKETKRLDNDQWQYLLDVATEMASQDSIYERNLFLIASLKTLFLRISEFSEREDWAPVMSHFWQDNDKNWWLKIFGKGRKLRDVTVPNDFLPYLERYRVYRGLTPLPGKQEHEPIVEKLRGPGGMSARQLARLVQMVLDRAFEKMKKENGLREAQIFQETTSHWLRHTGASLEIDRGRALKDVSEDLGHASMATTDSIYVQTVQKNRASSGKGRKV